MRLGRKNKKYYKDLHQQAYDRLTGMQAFGESKKQAVADGTEKDKIFSFSTYKAYWKHVKYFIKYIQEKHPECTTLKSAKKYVITAPLRLLASATSTACDRPTIIRLRAGKLAAAGGTPGGYSVTKAPCSAMRANSLAFSVG